MCNKKHMRVCAYINQRNLMNNIEQIIGHVGNDVNVMAVVKADAYGHGAIEISKVLNENYKVSFAVATIEEGIELRENGIDSPILILGYTFEESVEDLVRKNLSQSISSLEEALVINRVGKELNESVKVHVEIDTGMARLGIHYTEDVIELFEELKGLPFVEIEGVFTHFARADEEDPVFTKLQLSRFEIFLEELKKMNLDIPYIHAGNSAGVIAYQVGHYNQVRPGISLYGLYPSCEVTKKSVGLKPILTLKSHLVSIKIFEKGIPVSYGGTFVTNRKTKVGVIPVGYGDGYPRRLSSKGRVIIGGQFAPILGRVCMDKFMVDLTDIEDVKLRDEVILIGQDGDAFISVEEIAEKVGTINYEITCQLGKRIPRVYI